MNSTPVGQNGFVEPRISSWSPYVYSTLPEARELWAMVGLELDPEQDFVLERALGERDDGSWANFRVGVCEPRQNGKGVILEARELVGLFLLHEDLIIHSAHLFDTSLEAFNRLLERVESSPDLDSCVSRVTRSHGEEGLEVRHEGKRSRIRFRTRTKGGGRGFTGTCLIIDESMDCPDSFHGAILPILSAKPNAQIWYMGSAVDQERHEHGLVSARLREAGIRKEPRVAYFEWSGGAEKPHLVHDLADREIWRQANPAMGRRISEEYIEDEYKALDARSFAVERCGVGDWPRTDGMAERAIDPAAWRECLDPTSSALDPVCVAVDVTPDRAKSAVVIAGWREDRRVHVEIVEHARATKWVVDLIAGLIARNAPVGVVLNANQVGTDLLSEFEKRDIDITPISSAEYVQACGQIFDLVVQGNLRHLGQPEMENAVASTVKRPSGDAWAWSRIKSTHDISPFVGATEALWGLQTLDQPSEPTVWDMRTLLADDNGGDTREFSDGDVAAG